MWSDLFFVFVLALIPSWGMVAYVTRQNGLRAEVDALLTEESEVLRVDRGSSAKSTRKPANWRARLIGAGVFIALRLVTSTPHIVELFVFAGIGALASDLVLSRLAARRLEKDKRAIEFHLPLVMERVVMAVSAGLDIVPALEEASRDSLDPVSRMFRRVIELSSGGISVVDALESMGKDIEVSAAKHALVHLSLAYKEGGELIKPLRELSDATQLAYQEQIEEDIAKLPVKAVLPLVITFTGLIVCFLTVPLIQVSSLTQKVSQGAER